MTYASTLAFCCCILLVVTPSSLASWQRPASPTAAFMQMLQQTAFNFMQMEDEVEELPTAMRDVIYDALTVAQDQEPMSVLSCSVCMAAVVGINRLVEQNYTWSDIRDEAIYYCLALFNSTLGESIGETMCEPLADNYGPELLKIFTIKPAEDAMEVCVLFNSCAINDTLGEGVQSTEYVRPSLPAKSSSRDQVSSKSSAANNIRIVHITDIHVEESYLEGSVTDCGLYVCCLETNVGNGSANYWGNYGCNVPPRTTELFFQFIAAMDPPADFVLYTGDSPPHTSWEETREGQLAVSKWVADAMIRILPPGLRAYPAIGNHENFPGNLYYADREETQEFNQEFINYWQPLANWGAEQHATIRSAGYYTMPLRTGLRLLVFNSNYGYTFNWYNWVNIDRQEHAEMRQFINDTLLASEQAGEKVILVSHHPFNNQDGIIEWGHFIKAILLRYHATIVLYPYGHTHDDEFRVAIDEEGVAREIMMGGGTANSQSIMNPNIRIIEMDPITFELIDYSQYAIDLEPDNRNASIQLLYSALDEYNLPDMSAASWYDLTFRMETVNSPMFDAYYRNLHGGSGMAEDCGIACKNDYICTTRTIAYDELRDCTGRTA